MFPCFFVGRLTAVIRSYVRIQFTGHFLLVAGICGDAVFQCTPYAVTRVVLFAVTNIILCTNYVFYAYLPC